MLTRRGLLGALSGALLAPLAARLSSRGQAPAPDTRELAVSLDQYGEPLQEVVLVDWQVVY